ncbi:hypothetical protein [Novacetimonas hansenii]|nr:hypothetical protein [Novacetimonas hansenii]
MRKSVRNQRIDENMRCRLGRCDKTGCIINWNNKCFGTIPYPKALKDVAPMKKRSHHTMSLFFIGDLFFWESHNFQRFFENNALIKKKSFWVPPFFKKAASSEAFWKKLHQKPL